MRKSPQTEKSFDTPQKERTFLGDWRKNGGYPGFHKRFNEASENGQVGMDRGGVGGDIPRLWLYVYVGTCRGHPVAIITRGNNDTEGLPDEQDIGLRPLRW